MTDVKPMHVDSTLFQLQTAGTDRGQARIDGDRQGGLEQASRQFESLLLNFMIREMRATVPESGLLPTSMAEDLFTGMLDEQYADTLAERGGIGLHRLIVEQLQRRASED